MRLNVWNFIYPTIHNETLHMRLYTANNSQWDFMNRTLYIKQYTIKFNVGDFIHHAIHNETICMGLYTSKNTQW